MKKTIEITDANFNAQVLSSDVPVVVDFWAPWCGPCKMIAPILEDVAEEVGQAAKVAKLDVDQNPEKAAEFGVRSIPTLMLFKNGKAIGTKVGITPKDALIRWIKETN